VCGWLFQPGLAALQRQARSVWTIPSASAVQRSDSLGQDDLLVLVKLLEIACAWIWTQQEQAKSQAA
jgi:hypothetical protein